MSLVATRLQNWRIENPELDRNMTRPCEYGALDFFIEQTNAPSSIINPNLRDRAFASIGNTVQVPVINYDGDVQVSNVRSCVIADDENTSALETVVWATYAIGFTMVPAAYMNNEISYEHDFLRKMEKTCRALADKLDVGAVAALEANKTQVFKTLLNYTKTGNVVQVPTQMATEILGDINPIMRANCYPEYIHIIANAGVDSLIRKLAQHGVYNDVNKRMEYDNKVLHYTNNVTNETAKWEPCLPLLTVMLVSLPVLTVRHCAAPVRISTNGTLYVCRTLICPLVRTITPPLATSPQSWATQPPI